MATPPKHNPLLDPHSGSEHTTVYAPEGLPKNDVLGTAPTPHMSEPIKSDHMMTDITFDEMTAGKKASDYYSQRRQAELDYGKNFALRRVERIKEHHIVHHTK
jgi:hypothetical protein